MTPTKTEPSASKAAVDLAEQHQLDLSTVKGTGADGQITKPDVEKAIGAGGDEDKNGGDDEPERGAGGAGIGNVGSRPVVGDDGKVKDKAGTHYCPGCGLRYADPATCEGTDEAPHPPIDTAPVSELKKDGEHHTAAPDTE